MLAAEGIEGIVLRYGWSYGPGTALRAGGKYLEAIRRRQFPIIGDGTGVWSFIHIDDVASATLAAIERGAPGVYNIVDDEPAPVTEWLPFLALTIDAPPPRHIPAWLGRPLMGEHGLAMMNETRGAANTKPSASSAGSRAMRAGAKVSGTGSPIRCRCYAVIPAKAGGRKLAAWRLRMLRDALFERSSA